MTTFEITDEGAKQSATRTKALRKEPTDGQCRVHCVAERTTPQQVCMPSVCDADCATFRSQLEAHLNSISKLHYSHLEFRQMVRVYFENRMKGINSSCGHSAVGQNFQSRASPSHDFRLLGPMHAAVRELFTGAACMCTLCLVQLPLLSQRTDTCNSAPPSVTLLHSSTFHNWGFNVYFLLLLL
jgi:hypothetical protein